MALQRPSGNPGGVTRLDGSGRAILTGGKCRRGDSEHERGPSGSGKHEQSGVSEDNAAWQADVESTGT